MPPANWARPLALPRSLPAMDLLRILAIAVGGAVGATCRYGAVIACSRLWGDRFAWGVLLVNVIGCFLMGVLMHAPLVVRWSPNQALHALLTIGILGSLTTFSSFGYDTLQYLEQQRYVAAGTNVALNVVLGISACSLGGMLAAYHYPFLE